MQSDSSSLASTSAAQGLVAAGTSDLSATSNSNRGGLDHSPQLATADAGSGNAAMPVQDYGNSILDESAARGFTSHTTQHNHESYPPLHPGFDEDGNATGGVPAQAHQARVEPTYTWPDPEPNPDDTKVSTSEVHSPDPAMGELVGICNNLKMSMERLYPPNSKTGGLPADFPKFPEIVVVGAQSSGKSSVLEAIMCRGFLPRGQGIVTRRPLCITMRQSKTGEEKVTMQDGYRAEAVEISPAQVEMEINRATERKCGNNPNSVSDEVININITSRSVVDLTLIDLPGCRANPPDLEKKIDDMVKKFAMGQDVIILAVHNALMNFNNGVFDKVRALDPDGERTICVLTHVDALQSQDDRDRERIFQECIRTGGASLPKENFRAKLGYIPVKCRNIDELKNHVSVKDSLAAERVFFNENQRWGRPDECGIKHLTWVLHSLLVKRIFAKMREWRSRLNEYIAKTQRKLDQYVKVSDESAVRSYIQKAATDLSTGLKLELTTGTVQNEVVCRSQNALSQIQKVITKELAEVLKHVPEDEVLSEAQIVQDFANVGKQVVEFVNDTVAKRAVERILTYLRPKVMVVVDRFQVILLETIQACLPPIPYHTCHTLHKILTY